MAAGRSAAMKLDWTRLSSTLGLRGNTAQALSNFKKRNDDARRRVQQLQDTPQTVDFAWYRENLKNTQVVDEVEKHFNGYKVQSYDVSRQIKAIEGFESQAVKSAEETKTSVEKELQDLEKTLQNIESARPFEDLTVDDVFAAQPELEKRVEKMVSNHRWMPKGYREKFGDLSVL